MPKPDWLSDFAPYLDTGGVQEEIITTDFSASPLKLYKKDFLKDETISLGGNNGQSDTTSSYIVIIKLKWKITD